MNTLQLGIDLGRVIASTDHGVTSDTVRAAAQCILDALGLPLKIEEEPSLLLGLGYGLADRHKIPLEDETLCIMGQTSTPGIMGITE